jgi:hypothetical protein
MTDDIRDPRPTRDALDRTTLDLDAADRVRDEARDDTPAEVFASLTDRLGRDVSVDESLVTRRLDDVLLALVALRSDGTHGTGLMNDVEHVFGVEPSPGTVYPRLHDLEEAGPLACHDLVQTKQYGVADADDARERLERAVYQHLALGLFFEAALEEL